MVKVLITAPLKQDVRIFKEHQNSLDELVIPDGVQVDRFWVVNDDDDVISEIRGDYVVCNTGDLYRKTDTTHVWTTENLSKMHELRNMTIRRMLEGGYDYWFSVDTDLVLMPDTLRVLLEADKDIISEIFWTNGWCNAWLYDQSTGMDKEWLNAGVYQVGMTGACTLVKRRVFEAGVDYSPIPNIRKVLWGEDRHFCIRAACHDFTLWVDTHCPATHLYTEGDYIKYMRGKQNA